MTIKTGYGTTRNNGKSKYFSVEEKKDGFFWLFFYDEKGKMGATKFETHSAAEVAAHAWVFRNKSPRAHVLRAR